MPLMPPSARLAALRDLQLTLEGRMPEPTPRATIPPSPAGKMLCPKCGASMNLARRVPVPSGFYIRTFDCTGCDHAHIVTVADDFPGATRSPACTAVAAIGQVRQMQPGARPIEARKKVGFLRGIADNQGLFSSRRGGAGK